MSSKKIGLSGCVIFISLFFLSLQSYAQWKKISLPIFRPGIVYFQHSEGHPEIGFIGSWIEDDNGFRDTPTELWKTEDAGNTWHNIANPNWQGAVRDIFFKDALNGWAAIGHISQNLPSTFDGGVYYTKDGGETWKFLNGTFGLCSSIYFNKSNNLLFLNSWSQLCSVSSDNGITWQVINGAFTTTPDGRGSGNGFVFWDSSHGIISKVGPSITHFLFTSDGGISWQESALIEEAWQPLGIVGTQIGFAACEQTNKVFRTDDFGISWREVSQISTGGCIRGNTKIIVTQGENGFFSSLDSGSTWQQLCGPSNSADTRFQFINYNIFATGTVHNESGNYLWINTTGIGSNSTPQLSAISKSFNGLGCDPKFDSLITFTFFDSCNGIQAKLISAVLQGSNNFSFSSPSAIPRTIHPNDSLLISYNPNSSSADTASLHLKLHLGWKDFDTTIMLTGAGRVPKENVQFIPSLSANTVSAGSSVDILIKPNKPISGKALQSISFDLNYNSDLLDGGKIFSTNIPGAVISLAIPVETRHAASLPITITGNDLSLDPNSAIADLKFMAMITDTASTPITISNLKLNGGDVDYQNCILSADTSATNFTEIYLCGDSTLSKYLRTGNILSITSIHPNPAQDEVEIELYSAIKQDVNFEVFDALGVRVFSDRRNMIGGANTFHLDTKALSAGVYLVKVGNISQSFVKVK